MMTRLSMSLVAMLPLLLPAPHAAADNAAGVAAYMAGDFGTAQRELTAAAETGDTQAEVNLAMLYFNGKGIPRDLEKARHWFTQAAEAGNAQAEFLLAGMYLHGIGVEPDTRAALEWYDKAAAQGHAGARDIAAMIRNTPGAPADVDSAPGN
jgi:TPR repeat protein